MTSKGILAFAAAALLSSSALAQSLEDEVKRLLDTHPQIKVASNNVGSASEEVRRAYSGYLPSVRALAEYGPNFVDSPSRRANPGESSTRPRQGYSVTVTQNLFDGFGTTSSGQAAESNKGVSDATLAAIRQTVMLEGISAYLDVIRQSRLIELAGLNEDVIRRQLQLEDERVARGSGMTVDVLQAKSRLQISRERRVSFEGQLEDARSRYQQVFSTLPTPGNMTTPTPPLGNLPASLDEAIKTGISEHPALTNGRGLVDAARARKRAAASPYYPKLNLVGEGSWDKNEDGSVGHRREGTLKVQSTWELFSGFQTRAEVAQAAFQHASSLDNLAFIERKVEEEVRLAWQALDTARERVQLLQNAVNIASEVHTARGRLRELGKETVINVLDAENEVFNARINATSAQHDARVAVYRVLLATGRLSPETIGNLTELPQPPQRTAEAPVQAKPAAEKVAVVVPAHPVAKEASAPAAMPQPAAASAAVVATPMAPLAPVVAVPVATAPVLQAPISPLPVIMPMKALAESSRPAALPVQQVATKPVPPQPVDANFRRHWPFE
ncbi:MAG: hypothetical protein EXQ96_06225 [Alphaproteobacteria bacterium]|nr:hypothetical protein [Alphaproteobacteria bacterium]